MRTRGSAIRRGVFHSVLDLIAAMEPYMTASNAAPKPFAWTATAESILKKVQRVLWPSKQLPVKGETLTLTRFQISRAPV